jgi:hypothetical protein
VLDDILFLKDYASCGKPGIFGGVTMSAERIEEV